MSTRQFWRGSPPLSAEGISHLDFKPEIVLWYVGEHDALYVVSETDGDGCFGFYQRLGYLAHSRESKIEPELWVVSNHGLFVARIAGWHEGLT